VEACGRGFGEDFDLCRYVAGELAAVGGATTGCDAGGRRVVLKEMFEPGQGEKRFVEIVESELEEGRLFDDGAGFFKHLGGCGADDGDTDFTDTGTKKLRGYAGHIHSHVYNRGILQTRAQGCKFLLKSKGLREMPGPGLISGTLMPETSAVASQVDANNRGLLQVAGKSVERRFVGRRRALQ
jgi:hypothetical protein